MIEDVHFFLFVVVIQNKTQNTQNMKKTRRKELDLVHVLLLLALVAALCEGSKRFTCTENRDCRLHTCVAERCVHKVPEGGKCDDDEDCSSPLHRCLKDVCAVPQPWEPRAYSPLKVRDGGFVGLSNPNLFFMIGGLFPSGRLSDSVFVYDPFTNEWRQREGRMRSPRAGFGTAVVGGRVFIVGGDVFGKVSSLVEEFDPIADEWYPRSPMPTPRAYLGVAALGTRIYAIGGHDQEGNVLNTVEVYDITSDSWSSFPSMSVRRSRLQVVSTDDLIFVLGGLDQTTQATSIVEIFDPKLSIWSFGPSLISSRFDFSASFFVYPSSHPSQQHRRRPVQQQQQPQNASIIVFGGRNDRPIKEVEEFCFEKYRWTSRPSLPSPRCSLMSASHSPPFLSPLSPSFGDLHGVFVLGGDDARSSFLNNLDLFHPLL